MILTVRERLLLLNALPPRAGNITTVRIARELRESLSFTEAEHEKFGIKMEGEQIQWDPTRQLEAEVTIGPKGFEIVADALRGMSERDEMTEDYVPLWDKFVPEGT